MVMKSCYSAISPIKQDCDLDTQSYVSVCFKKGVEEWTTIYLLNCYLQQIYCKQAKTAIPILILLFNVFLLCLYISLGLVGELMKVIFIIQTCFN